jgi:hypothetical protein
MEPGWSFPDCAAHFDAAEASPVAQWARIEGRGAHGAEELLCRLRMAERQFNTRRRRPAVRRMGAFITRFAALLASWAR